MATTYIRTPARKPEVFRTVTWRSSRVFFLMITLFLAVLFEGALDGAAARSPARPSKGVQQSVTIAVLPPISQPGKLTASPGAARTVVTAAIRPRAEGRPVVLEGRRNGLWRAVEWARLDKDGRESFTASTWVGGRAATYRVRATAYHGLPSVHSDPVRANAWGQPAFVDGFNGKTLSPAWQHRGQVYSQGAGRMASKGDPSAVAVGNGALRLTVLADPARTDEQFIRSDADGGPKGSFAYRLNGHVGTQGSFSFQYGIAAARMKFQQARGQHPSFWMQPNAGMGSGAEIDIIEWFGKSGAHQRLATNIYPHPDYENNSTWFGGRIPKPNQYLQLRSDTWWAAYHVFSVEWTPREYVFRIDGQETMRITQGISHEPEYLILSLLSSDFELGWLGGDEHLPQHAFVDWVQVWPTK